MPKRIRVNFPKESNKKYFSFKNENYKNDINVYVNDTIIFPHINDAEEFLPISLDDVLNLDENKENIVKFAYEVSFGTVNEKVDLIFKLKTNGVCETNICRYNFVEGSEKLTDDFLITFVVNDQITLIGKEYHEGNTANITFDNYYTYPLKINWSSKIPFTDTTNYWDETELRLE